jgi:hypothetical protein
VTEALVVFRGLVIATAFPVTVDSKVSASPVINIVVRQVLYSLFRPGIEIVGGIVYMEIFSDIQSGFFVSRNKNIVKFNIGVGVVTEGKSGKIVNVGLQQAAAEIRRGVGLQPLESRPDMGTALYFFQSRFGYIVFGSINDTKTVVRAVEYVQMFYDFPAAPDIVVHRGNAVAGAIFDDSKNHNQYEKEHGRYCQ